MPATPIVTRKRLLVGAGVLLLLLVALALLAIPFRSVPADARRAQAEVTAAAEALKAGDMRTAAERTERARQHVDRVTGVTEGVSGTVWSWVPVAGSGVRDVRHLAAALDDVTSILEIGVDVRPRVMGERATLIRDGGEVDMGTLEAVLGDVEQVGDHLAAARSELEDVDGSAPFVGDTVSTYRDRAMEQVVPLADAFAKLEPVLPELPGLLGAEGERRYLVALLNPAELRYSGGAPLSFASIRLDEGEMEMGETLDTESDRAAFQPTHWRKVQGNPFHRYTSRISKANFAPSWSVSGQEMLRAWRQLRGQNRAGLIAVDVVALADLLRVTGPVEVPTYGTLTAGNLVERLVGSYDEFALAGIETRRESNKALVGEFASRLFSGEDLVAKVQSLDASAGGRHFAMYFRDEELQAAIEDVGWDGDLADTDHDYLGVFSQSLVGAKSDYWQQRKVSSEVTLREDGSAEVRLRVDVDNDSPPYLQPVPDPGEGYFTRWNHVRLAAFLPRGAEVDSLRVDGEQRERPVGDYYGRPFVRTDITLAPQETATMEVTYTVPAAAVVEGDELTYHLDADPQGMVDDQTFEVSVTWPKGYRVGDLPEGWTAAGPRAARFEVRDLAESSGWEITGRSS